MKLWSKVLQIFLFSLYFSSLSLKYLKLTKMDITRFAMKLFKCTSWREHSSNSSYFNILEIEAKSALHNIMSDSILLQSDLSYPATSGPAHIRISDLAGYERYAWTQQVQ